MAKNTAFSAHVDTLLKNSYDTVAVHEKMIKDKIRTLSYQKAIERNPELLKDKIVLDVGCGTGILSMFAVRAGAKHVYAVDVSNMIKTASEIARINGMADRITFVLGKAEEVDLPKVDIIISEWMGFCLFSEFTLDCVLDARNKHLVAGGVMMPNKTSVHLAAIEDPEMRISKIDFTVWNNVHGLDFTPIKPPLFATGFLGTPNSETVTTEAICLLDLDLQKIDLTPSLFESIPFRLVAHRATVVHAFLMWFDYSFTAGIEQVCISTGPFAPPTHWKQTIFHVETPLALEVGEALIGHVSFGQCERDLNVKLVYKSESQNKDTVALYKVEFIE